ncbi:60S ribosomal protein L18 [Gurleya vavrai]
MRLVTTRKRKQIKPRQLKPISPNTELHALSALYMKISENTTNTLIHKISKKLRTTLNNMVPVKISQLKPDIVNVVVAKVLDDDCIVQIPKVTVVCLKISRGAKETIEMFGGKVYKLDELFHQDLSKCELISNDPIRRKKARYYGAPGEKGSKALIKKMFKKKDVTKRPS